MNYLEPAQTKSALRYLNNNKKKKKNVKTSQNKEDIKHKSGVEENPFTWESLLTFVMTDSWVVSQKCFKNGKMLLACVLVAF